MAPAARSADTDVTGDVEGDVEGDEHDTCSVCWELPRTTVFLACGHCLLCGCCAARLLQQRHPSCPLCRMPLLADDCYAAECEGGHVFTSSFQVELVDDAATQRAHARREQLAAEAATEAAQWGDDSDGDAPLPWLDVEGGETLRQLRDNEPALSALDLNGQDVGDEGAAALGEALRHNSLLTALLMNDTLLGAAGTAALAAGLAGHASLTRLDVGGNEVGAAGAAALAAAASTPGCTLTRLDACKCGLDDAAAKSLARALRRGGSGDGLGLTVLNLGCNFLSGRGAAALLASGAGRGLRQLDVSANALCDGRAVAALCALLRESSSLVHLDISYNEHLLDNRGYVVDLCAALRACVQLHTLRLAGTAAHGDRLALLCQALCAHPALADLDVSDTPIRYYGHGDAEVALCELLRSGGTLAKLRARNIGLEEEHAPLLADALRSAGAALVCVDLGGNELARSSTAAAMVRAAARQGLTVEGLLEAPTLDESVARQARSPELGAQP